MCRTYGAPDFLCDFSQAYRPGLSYAAPAALAPRLSKIPFAEQFLDVGGFSGEAEAADVFF
jgi:hypothetical protein